MSTYMEHFIQLKSSSKVFAFFSEEVGAILLNLLFPEKKQRRAGKIGTIASMTKRWRAYCQRQINKKNGSRQCSLQTNFKTNNKRMPEIKMGRRTNANRSSNSSNCLYFVSRSFISELTSEYCFSASSISALSFCSSSSI